MSWIKILDLECNEIGVEGGKALAKALQANNTMMCVCNGWVDVRMQWTNGWFNGSTMRGCGSSQFDVGTERRRVHDQFNVCMAQNDRTAFATSLLDGCTVRGCVRNQFGCSMIRCVKPTFL